MNLGQLQAECARLLSDVGNNRWSTDVLTTRLNIAQQVVQGYATPVKTNQSLTVTAGVNFCNLTNADTMNILRVTKVFADGTQRPLVGKTEQELDYLLPDWANFQAGDPQYWIYSATLQQIYLVPTPDSSVVSLSLLTSVKPADMVSSTDLPFGSNNQMIPYHITLCHWVVAQCFEDDGTQEALVKAKFHRSGNMLSPGEFEKNLGRIMSEFDVPDAIPARVFFRPQGGRLGYVYAPSKSSPFLY